MRNQVTIYILLATCGIALGPIVYELVGPRSKARWLLAQAANDFEAGSVDAAKSYLDKAAKVSPEIAVDPEYWNLRFEIAFGKEGGSDEELTKLNDDAKQLVPHLPSKSRIAIAREASLRCREKKRMDLAIHIMESCFPPKEDRTPEENNELAYFRALAKSDLELALEEIDLALRTNSEVELLDTKAWVLHRLRRNPIAIEWADECLRRVYEQLKSSAGSNEQLLAIYLFLEPDDLPNSSTQNPTNGRTSDPNSESVVGTTTEKSPSFGSQTTEKVSTPSALELLREKYPSMNTKQILALAKNIAVMRFHRACILDDLHRTEESERDYAWLDRFGFSETQELE